MTLKTTVKKLEEALYELCADFQKAKDMTNKAAAQRVRKGTLQFAKIAKLYRKESVAAGRSGKKRAGSKKRAAPKKKKAAVKRKPAKKTTARRKTTTRRKTAKRRR